ncbi:hypothetical protein [Nocardia sp. NPDC024068]|uniref:hypothetical protein n=1 Tax=Nocardia sp. NPDC024068 TaxID=3157197 RepID=UPI0033F6E366
MNPWSALCTAAFAVALCGIAVTILGCVWPTDPPPIADSVRRPRCPSTTVPSPTAWTCALPGVPLSVDDAHNAMRHHRTHDCPRKRAAFATLTTYGCLVPDHTRAPYRRQAAA